MNDLPFFPLPWRTCPLRPIAWRAPFNLRLRSFRAGNFPLLRRGPTPDSLRPSLISLTLFSGLGSGKRAGCECNSDVGILKTAPPPPPYHPPYLHAVQRYIPPWKHLLNSSWAPPQSPPFPPCRTVNPPPPPFFLLPR